ncbi:MAG: putative pterin-4-alpha-carbinolamine dehydratase [Chlamydiae bacterium]|nr:putative pterin-4-alpha-carbinolamine dehydratase [Chlamydiota bacterium]
MGNSCSLSKKSCVPCRGGIPPLRGVSIQSLLSELQNDWKVENEHHLIKEFTFENFKDALNFTNRVGEIAEREVHHPDIMLSWGKVVITLWTHKIDGLTESDFILAAKCDDVYKI